MIEEAGALSPDRGGRSAAWPLALQVSPGVAQHLLVLVTDLPHGSTAQHGHRPVVYMRLLPSLSFPSRGLGSWGLARAHDQMQKFLVISISGVSSLRLLPHLSP